MGTALMAQVLSRRMQRRGRRPGLVLGYGLAAAGGVDRRPRCRDAVARDVPRRPVRVRERSGAEPPRPLRGDRPRRARRAQPGDEPHRVRVDVRRRARAVDDRTDRARRARPGSGSTATPDRGCSRAVFFVVAASNTAIRLRPDPLVAAGGVPAGGSAQPPLELGSTIRVISGHAGARLAVTAMVISQVTMVAVMAMTPVHLKLHGHEGLSQYVVSLHIAGMYAFSPLVGRYSDRRGRIRAISRRRRAARRGHDDVGPVRRRRAAAVPVAVAARPRLELRTHRRLQPPRRERPVGATRRRAGRRRSRR